MEAEKIKKFIDNMISSKLSLLGYDGVRQYLSDNILKYREIVYQKLGNSKFKYELENIEKLESSRNQYLAYYVFYGQKRIIDLYYLENRLGKIGYPSERAFKALLLKEKLTL